MSVVGFAPRSRDAAVARAEIAKLLATADRFDADADASIIAARHSRREAQKARDRAEQIRAGLGPSTLKGS